MKSYYKRSRDSSAGDGCFSIFQRKDSAHVVPDSVSLSTLFAALMYGFRGDRAAGAAKVIELSQQFINTHTLNHLVAGWVLRALAVPGTATEFGKFWSFCNAQLGRSRQGWPGSSFKILSDLSQKFRGRGQWLRISQLLALAAAPRTLSSASNQSK
jgi:hypothetical protein